MNDLIFPRTDLRQYLTGYQTFNSIRSSLIMPRERNLTGKCLDYRNVCLSHDFWCL